MHLIMFNIFVGLMEKKPVTLIKITMKWIQQKSYKLNFCKICTG